MKKLLIASMTVALAAGAWADAESFESAEAGDWAVATPWATEDTGAKVKVVTYGDGDTAYTYATSGDNTRATTFGSDQAKYLSVDTASTKPLWRSIADGSATIADDAGYVFDALVQFTGTDTAPTLATGDRFLLWLNTEGATPVLTVTCGVIGGTTTVQVPLDASVAEGTWARVTIKDVAITTELTGFIVFIDGKVAAATSADDYAVGTISSEYKEAKGRAAKYQLFPSAATGLTVTKIGFEGTCKLDDLQMVAQASAPAFTVFNATPDPVAPGVASDTFDTEDAAKSYAEAKSVVVPEFLTGDAATTYKSFLKGTVSGSGTEWTVTFDIDSDKEADLATTADSVIVKALSGAAELTGAQPGFYYALLESTTEGGDYTALTDWAQADADGKVAIEITPSADKDADFFKVGVRAYAPASTQE